MFSKGVPSAEILWFHRLFKIQVLKYVKRDQKLKNWTLTFLRLNLAEIWLKKQAPAPGFHLGTSNGDLLLLQCGKPNKKFTSHLQNHQQWVKHPRMEGVSWHPRPRTRCPWRRSFWNFLALPPQSVPRGPGSRWAPASVAPPRAMRRAPGAPRLEPLQKGSGSTWEMTRFKSKAPWIDRKMLGKNRGC